MDDTLQKTGLVKVKTVLRFIEMSESAWWAGVAAGLLPQPKRRGGSTFWDAGDIHELIRNPSRTNWPVYQEESDVML